MPTLTGTHKHQSCTQFATRICKQLSRRDRVSVHCAATPICKVELLQSRLSRKQAGFISLQPQGLISGHAAIKQQVSNFVPASALAWAMAGKGNGSRKEKADSSRQSEMGIWD